jgi:hypothetical protein
MARFPRLTPAKIILGIVLMVLSVVGVAVGVAVGVEGASAATTYPPVDHQLCYKAAVVPPGFEIPPAGSVRLIDQFAPNGIVPTIGALKFNCNPVQKTITTAAGSKVTPITNPVAHLACFKITAPTKPPVKVSVTNQFGTGILNVGQPQLLCLPTWKSLTGPPVEPTNQPPNLNHFTCYSVTYVPGTAPYKVPGAVSLQDEFSPTASVPVTVATPQLLCLPTEKIITAGGATTTYPIINPKKHLLCFGVSQTPFPTTVFDLNQFGQSPVNILKIKLLCLPSTKKVLP